jgi:hypothetical protein
MPASFVFGGITVAPGRQTWWFTFSWPPGQHPNKGPVFCVASPNHPADRVDIKLVIEDYAQARSTEGPVYYYGLISNLGTETVGARMMGVYFPEFQSDWEM